MREELDKRDSAVGAARALEAAVGVPPPEAHDAAALFHDGVRGKSHERRLPLRVPHDDRAITFLEAGLDARARFADDRRDDATTLPVERFEFRGELLGFVRIVR